MTTETMMAAVVGGVVGASVVLTCSRIASLLASEGSDERRRCVTGGYQPDVPSGKPKPPTACGRSCGSKGIETFPSEHPPFMRKAIREVAATLTKGVIDSIRESHGLPPLAADQDGKADRE